MVGCTKAKTHNFSILQTNADSCKVFRILQMLNTNTISFSLLVIALHANTLRMFLTNVVIASAACLSAFSIFSSFTTIASGFFCLCCLVFSCSSHFSVALRLNCTPFFALTKHLTLQQALFLNTSKTFFFSC